VSYSTILCWLCHVIVCMLVVFASIFLWLAFKYCKFVSLEHDGYGFYLLFMN